VGHAGLGLILASVGAALSRETSNAMLKPAARAAARSRSTPQGLRTVLTAAVLLGVVCLAFAVGSFSFTPRRRVAHRAAVGDPFAVVSEDSEGRRFVLNERGDRVSPWHDLPQRDARQPGRLATFVVEIPAGSTAKLEVDKGAAHNPIVQDTDKSGAPRHYPAPAPFTYGLLPRTYEHPGLRDALTGEPGDGDPVDAIDLTPYPAGDGRRPGDVYAVRVLGALAMSDGGASDWKVVVVSADASPPPFGGVDGEWEGNVGVPIGARAVSAAVAHVASKAF
jgi:inorganic pyrophosphatase